MSDRLDALLEGHDALDLLAAMLQASFAGFAPPAERWTRPATVLTEYLMARLLRRRASAARSAAREPMAIVDLALQLEGALAVERMAGRNLDRDDLTGQLGSSHRRFNEHEVMMYDPAIVEHEIRRLPELFGPFSEELRRVTGVDIEGVLEIVDALNAHAFAWMFRELRVDRPAGRPEDLIELLGAAAASGAGEYVRPGSGRTLALSRRQLAALARRSMAEVDAFLSVFAIRPPLGHVIDPFDRLVYRLRQRPVVDWDDRVLVPVSFNLTVAIRPRLEAELRHRGGAVAPRYDEAKGKWLERETLRLAHEMLAPDQLYRDLHLARSHGSHPQRDALARVDMCLLAIECKGGGVSASARKGSRQSQQATLDRLVHQGVEQAQSTLAALRAGEDVTGVEMPANNRRVTVDIGNTVRELTVVVTLEDVGGVSARTQVLFGERLHARDVPLVLSIDDLEWYGRELGSRILLLHYLVVRQRLAASTMAMLDESDWFRLYLMHGAPGIAEWLVAMASVPSQVIGWVGNARRGVPEPRMVRWAPPLLPVVERWADEREDGWLEGAIALLDMSEHEAAALEEGLTEGHRQATEGQDYALLSIRPAAESTTALHILLPPPTEDDCSSAKLASMISANSRNGDRQHLIASCVDGALESLNYGGIATVRPAQPTHACGGA